MWIGRIFNKPSFDALRVRAAIPVEQLRSIQEYEFKSVCQAHGVGFFGLPVRQTPHFLFIQAYRAAPGAPFEQTVYWKLADTVLGCFRQTDGARRSYRHNRSAVINAPEDMCRRFISLLAEIEKTRHVQPIDVVALSDGTFIITDGLHRAAIASLLGWKLVPAVIRRVDPQLRLLMEDLRDSFPAPGRKYLYTPIEHPVFSDWKVLRDATRWRMIRDEFDWAGKRVIDIGSYTGFFAQQAARRGARVTGLEQDDQRLGQSRALNRLLGVDPEYLHADFRDFLAQQRADCLICFSVLHWILKKDAPEGFKKALDTLSRAAPVMFFDMGQDNEPKMRSREWNHGLAINRKTIPDLVVRNSLFTHWKHLGTGDTGRDVYKFYRE
ncbi:MAG TPA: methyltransferase domain-containing protein [Candidatus Omnitrophota bacterium]|nr:methyltransferase domain-containing protein [Candidatus Omnitrophota bacterium]HRZ14510.1 methyltransferase domain-containing protein [Candidatus Omnitrophota bacterium]